MSWQSARGGNAPGEMVHVPACVIRPMANTLGALGWNRCSACSGIRQKPWDASTTSFTAAAPSRPTPPFRLAKFFDTTPAFWLGLPIEYDLRWAKRNSWPAEEANVRSLDAA